MPQPLPYIVVGAGLSGLACALSLKDAGRQVLVLEAGDGVGGRVRTDSIDGFLLDRGFQVLQTGYPEAQRVLDYDALELCPFDHGAHIVDARNQVRRMYDPLRSPIQALQNAFAGIGTLEDKVLVGRLRFDVTCGTLEELWRRPDQTTLEFLRGYGFSNQIIEGFFRPWFHGVFFERELSTSANFFRFVFRMFAIGDTSLPARGMGQICAQMAGRLPADAVRLNTRVAAVGAGKVTLEDGREHLAAGVVLAVDGPEAHRLTRGVVPAPQSRQVACLYFDAPTHDLPPRVLLLNATGRGVVTNLSLISSVSKAYAPEGKNLVSVSVVEHQGMDDAALETAVRNDLRDIFNQQPAAWSLIKTYRIHHALPAMAAGELKDGGPGPLELADGVIVTGDHRQNASIQGALVSGRLAAQRLLARPGA